MLRMADRKIDLLCVGNALVDVFAQVDEQFLVRHGLTRPVQHIEIEKIKTILSELRDYTIISGGAQKPRARHRACSSSEGDTACPPENLSPVKMVSWGAQKPRARHRACSSSEGDTACPPENLSPVKMVSGGGGANVAKIAGLLGVKVSFTGAVGNDEFGRLFKKSLAAAGVKLRLAIKPSPTGVCLMLRNKAGEILIAASPSAATLLSESDIGGEEPQVVLIDGFMLDKTALVSHILSMVGRNDSISTAAIDLSSPSIAREYAAEIADFAKNYPLILFMNEAETEAFSDGLKIKSVMQETLFEKNTNFPIIIVKMGQDGALFYSGGKIFRAETQAVTPVDATGAGDAFCAGFLSAWVKNKALSECAAFGNMTARTVLGAEGSQADKKALKVISKLLSK